MDTRGLKKREWLEFSFQNTGEPIRFPVGTIYGQTPGPTMVVVGGMHGSEFCGIQAAIDLYNEVDPARLRGNLVIVTIYNLPAFQNHMGFVVPQDGRNPGGTFPGKLNGTFSEVMAHHLTTQILSQADYYVELHGGDIPESLTPFVMCPRTGNAEVDKKIEEMANAYNIPLVISRTVQASDKPASGFTKVALRGVPAILTESGQQGILNMDDAQVHLTGLRNILIKLGMLDGEVVNTVRRTYLEAHAAIRSPMVGYWVPLVKLNQKVSKEEVVGEIRDYFGERLMEIRTPDDALVTVVRTSPSVGVGNVLVELHTITGQE